MSTRCQIGFYETANEDLLKPDALLYQHCDGYPTTDDGKFGVLPDLVPFLKSFAARRGLDDVEYASAWALYHLIDLHVRGNLEVRATNLSAYYSEDGRDCLGYGVCKGFHHDIEFYYAVCGAVLKVFRVRVPARAEKIQKKHFRLIQTVRLDAPADVPPGTALTIAKV